MMNVRRRELAAGLLLCLSVAGCGMKLETGYDYRPLTASSAERRAYYASPFSPEKAAAEHEKKTPAAAGLGQ
jgi:hypothetical protein